MATSFETIEALHRRGEFGEAIRASDVRVSRQSIQDPRTRALVAHALAVTGDYDDAWRLAELEIRSTNSSVRARAEYVLGLVSHARGAVDSAAEHLETALRLAKESGHWEQAGWADVSLFRLLSNAKATGRSPIQLSQVRRSVARAGDAHVSTFLHVNVAALEGQAGRFDEALRHCDVADSLLQKSPNYWLTASVHLNRASIASLQCNFEVSSKHVREGRELALKTGDARSVLMFDNNAAHIETAVGHFDSARRLYNRLLASRGATSSTLLGATEGLARLELALGEYDKCDAVLNQLERQVESNRHIASHYSARWATITRVRLLLKRGEFTSAQRRLEHLEAEFHSVKDLPFIAILQLLMAEALRGVGDLAGASRRMMATSEAGIVSFKELQHDYYASIARVIGGTSCLGTKFRERASRVATHFRIAASGDSTETQVRFEANAPVQPADLTDSLGALVDLAFSADLFGSECLLLLQQLGFDDARLIHEQAPQRRTIGNSCELLIAAGDKRRVSVVCKIPDEPLKALLLADVLRIARAALALERFKQEERNRAALWPADPIETESGALFLSEQMQEILSMARRVAAANIPVLITGETGTGKEVLARLIHAYSPRAKATFMPFNCTATPREMLDAQLFGHRRGSFTGATDHFQGVIRAAGGGTLFLDEIGETTLDVQPKLLRFLEASEVHPIGEAHPTRVDVRVIAATNADLDGLVAEGRFREDLFYRLNTVKLHVPPLRERRVEIPALAIHYLRKYAQENHKGGLRLAEDTIEYLLLYRWPGNVRQLANEMRRMAVLAENGAVLMPEHLSPELAASRRTLPPSDRTLDDTEVVVRLDQPMPAGVGHLERAMIRYALEKCGGRLEETATMLGISRKGLYLKRVRYGFEPAPGERPAADDVSAADVA